MEKVLEARNVDKVFEEGSQTVAVLHGVSMDVRVGEVVALEGPSGSGKTTLLSILGCILAPSAGSVTIAGERADGLDAEALAALGDQGAVSPQELAAAARRLGIDTTKPDPAYAGPASRQRS